MACLACLSARLKLNFRQEFFPQVKHDPVNLWIREVTYLYLAAVELLEMAMHTQVLHICVQTDWTYLQKTDSGSDFQLSWCGTKSSCRNGESKEYEALAKSVALLVQAMQVTSALHQFLHIQCAEKESPVWQRGQRSGWWLFVRRRHRDAHMFSWLCLGQAHLVPSLQVNMCSHTWEKVHSLAKHS